MKKNTIIDLTTNEKIFKDDYSLEEQYAAGIIGKFVKKIFSENEDKNVKDNDIDNVKSVILNDRELCDLELLLNGAFDPLEGFLNQVDYNSVLDNKIRFWRFMAYAHCPC